MAARLSALERARIEALRSEGVRCEDIAAGLGRHPSTVWRELRRGRDADGGVPGRGGAGACSAASHAQARSRPRAGFAGAPRTHRESQSFGEFPAAARAAARRGRAVRAGPLGECHMFCVSRVVGGHVRGSRPG